ncbi:NADP-dependent oxidoreductase domain-containing protein [Mycena galericulata]|nr:NADP-dependent oxidoreductase domain-containing protein [Mycena galericulata]
MLRRPVAAKNNANGHLEVFLGQISSGNGLRLDPIPDGIASVSLSLTRLSCKYSQGSNQVNSRIRRPMLTDQSLPRLQGYEALPSDVGSREKSCSERPRRTLLRVFSALVLMVMFLYGVRHVSRTGLSRCVGGGLHRNLTSLPSHYTLPSGDKIPSVALDSTEGRLSAHRRRVNLQETTQNEAEVGQALKDSGVPREDVWITSKLWNTFHAPEDIEPALDDSLAKLGTEYLDMYLIHWPVAKKDGQPYDKDLTENPYPTWKKLEEMVEKGKVRNIGVSNFNIRRLENLTANPLKIQPAVNQVDAGHDLRNMVSGIFPGRDYTGGSERGT